MPLYDPTTDPTNDGVKPSEVLCKTLLEQRIGLHLFSLATGWENDFFTHAILAGDLPIGRASSVAIATVTNTPKTYWADLQQKYDKQSEIAESNSGIPTCPYAPPAEQHSKDWDYDGWDYDEGAHIFYSPTDAGKEVAAEIKKEERFNLGTVIDMEGDSIDINPVSNESREELFQDWTDGIKEGEYLPAGVWMSKRDFAGCDVHAGQSLNVIPILQFPGQYEISAVSGWAGKDPEYRGILSTRQVKRMFAEIK